MSDDSRKISVETGRKNHAAFKKAAIHHITFNREDILDLLKDPEADLRVYLGAPNAFAVGVTGKEDKIRVGTETIYRSFAECPPICIPPDPESPF
jgi:hypothetical protein